MWFAEKAVKPQASSPKPRSILILEIDRYSETKTAGKSLCERGLSYSCDATKVALNIVSIFIHDGLTSLSGGCLLP
jgi:hypothetical protein